MLANRAQLAEFIGVSTPTIDRMVKQGAPYISRPQQRGRGESQFESGEFIAWHIEQHRQKAGEGIGVAAHLARAQLRDVEARGAIRDIELSGRLTNLIHVDDIAPIVAEQFALVRERVEAVPGLVVDAIAGEQDADAIQRLLRGAIIDALEDVSSS